MYEHNVKLNICKTHNIDNTVSYRITLSFQDAAFKIWIADQRSKDISRSLETLGHIVESAIQVYVRHDPARPVTYRWLRSIAHLRFALGLFGDMLSSYVADTPDKLPLTARNSKMLGELVEFLSPLLLRENLQELSLYLAKHLARRHGMKILRCLYNQGHRFVLPRALHQQVSCTKVTPSKHTRICIPRFHICSNHCAYPD